MLSGKKTPRVISLNPPSKGELVSEMSLKKTTVPKIDGV